MQGRRRSFSKAPFGLHPAWSKNLIQAQAGFLSLFPCFPPPCSRGPPLPCACLQCLLHMSAITHVLNVFPGTSLSSVTLEKPVPQASLAGCSEWGFLPPSPSVFLKLWVPTWLSSRSRKAGSRQSTSGFQFQARRGFQQWFGIRKLGLSLRNNQSNRSVCLPLTDKQTPLDRGIVWVMPAPNYKRLF